ncbi:MAG: PQQ-binding-like beta-propeller repeat protein [Planctomycetota bacterium]
MTRTIPTLCLVLIAPALAAAEAASESVFFDEESDVTALVEKGDAALKKGDWEGALDAWQKVLGDFPGAVLPAADGLWLPATVACSRRIAALPPAAIAAYRDRYETQASQKMALGTVEGLRAAAEQFFCTDSGGVAMERLGAMHADAGAIELAMRCWEQVAERHPAKKATPATLARLGLIYVRLGFPDKAKALVEKHGTLKVKLKGVETTIAVALNNAMAAPPPAPRTAVILPDLTFAPIPDSALEPRSVKWRLELGQPVEERPRPGVWIRRGGSSGALQTYPSTADGKLFVNLGRSLIALDSATGEFQWQLGGPRGDAVVGQPFKLSADFFQHVTPDFWVHRWYAVISDGVLYANLTTTGKWCHLKAVRVDNSRAIWSNPDAGSVPDFDLSGPPLPWRDHVYVGGVPRDDAKRGEVWLFAFDRRTGMLEWKTFIAGYQQQGNRFGGGMPMPVFAPVVAASGSYVYVCTNNGALACVGHTGSIVWATKYPKPTNYNPWGWMEQAEEDTWDLSPIFAIGRDLVFLPADGTHCCRLDAITGRGFKAPADPDEPIENPLRAMKVVAREGCRHLIAVDGENATLVGAEGKIYDLRGSGIVKFDGKAAFSQIPSQYCGRALVTKESVLVPVRGKSTSRLLVFDRKFGASREIPWPAEGAPGTLMIAGKLLLSISPREIVALSDEPPKDGEKKPGEDDDKPEDPDPPQDPDDPK